MREIVIGRTDAGQRLDKFLSKALPGLPQSMMYKYIRTKKIKRNRARTAPNDQLCEGDTLQLFIREEFFGMPEEDVGALDRIKPKLEICYEDENILVLNKRPGVLVHQDEAGGENTLILHIQAYLHQKGEYDPAAEQSFAPALCHRIDRNTGGLVLAAKNAAALRVMNEKIRNGEIGKFYLCAVHGKPAKPEATLHGWLIKDSAANTVSVSDHRRHGAKEIITRYVTIASREDASLLEVELLTGRTHQIRAHLAHIGHPLLGDGKYGVNREDKRRGYKYQALYAYRLRFNFADGDGPLAYLRGREVALAPDRIWFVRDFA